MAGQRDALIIATGRYEDQQFSQLRAPAQDASGLARVLQDPAIGAFDVKQILNEPAHMILRRTERFFTRRNLNDLLLIYVSCHGVKDDDGQLYFAAVDTEKDLLASTTVSAASLRDFMKRCRARSIVLLLDCCYSGAFMSGAKGDRDVHLKEQFTGQGHAILTATNAIEYAWEGDELTGYGQERSVFTEAVIDGLRTGEADRDGDGNVSFDELYAHVNERVGTSSRGQTPQKWVFGLQADLYIARNPFATTNEPILAVGPAGVRGSSAIRQIGGRPSSVRGDLLRTDPKLIYQIAKEMSRGRVIIFLGPGINLLGRPQLFVWRDEEQYFPPTWYEVLKSTVEWSELLSLREGLDDLPLPELAEIITTLIGMGPLWDRAYDLLNRSYEPNLLHEWLAALPRTFRAAGLEPNNQLIFTVNYDNTLERAFDRIGEPYDIIYFDRFSKQYFHVTPNEQTYAISQGNTYHRVSTKNRSVIFKLVGSVSRKEPEHSSFLMTESDYDEYEYGTERSISKRIPVAVVNELSRSHILFLNVGPYDWYAKAFLRPLFGGDRPRFPGWVARDSNDVREDLIWQRYGIHVVRQTTASLVRALRRQLLDLLAQSLDERRESH